MFYILECRRISMPNCKKDEKYTIAEGNWNWISRSFKYHILFMINDISAANNLIESWNFRIFSCLSIAYDPGLTYFNAFDREGKEGKRR